MSQQGSKKIVLPRDVSPDHVLGLLEVLHTMGGLTDSMYVGDAVHENIQVLPKAIDVAEALGLIKTHKGNLQLTELGKRVARSDPKSIKNLLRNAISNIEPLAEIASTLKEKKRMTVEEFDAIIGKYYPGNVEEARKNVLIWGAFLHLFVMDEEDEEILPI